ncbi:MAG: hypothetical protein D6730_13830 [Bacteroidetes bacterium]|nr:MAG: hypothetical protein D6730_13830 [Bacteroidota bacterium]
MKTISFFLLLNLAAAGLFSQGIDFFYPGATGEWKLTSTEPAIRFSFFVINKEKESIQVELEHSTLEGPNGIEVPLSLKTEGKLLPNDSSLSLPSGSMKQLVLSASLPEPGAYTAGLLMRYKLKDQVSHSPKTISFTYKPRAAHQSTLTLKVDHNSYAGTGDFQISGLLTGDSLPQRVAIPHLELSYSPSNGENYGVDRSDFSHCFSIDDSCFQADDSKKDSKKDSTTGKPSSPSFIDLPAHLPQEFQLTIDDLSKPGKYAATLRIPTAKGGQEVSFTLFVHRPIWWAVALILLGIITSAVIRYFTQNFRPRLEQRRDISELYRGLEEFEREYAGQLNEKEARVVQELKSQLEDWDQQLKDSKVSSMQSRLEQMAARVGSLHKWIKLRLDTQALKPESLRPQFEQKYEVVYQYLRSGKGAEEASTILQSFEGEMKTKVREKLSGEVQSVLGSIDQLGLSVEDSMELKKTCEDIEKKASSDYLLEEAYTDFEQLRIRLAKLQANRFAQKLAEITQPPPIFSRDRNQWDQLKRKVREQLKKVMDADDPAQALAAYRDAQMLYYGHLYRQFKAHCQALRQEFEARQQDASEAVDPSRAATALGLLEQAEAQMEAMRLAAEANNWAESEQKYQEGEKLLAQFEKDFGLADARGAASAPPMMDSLAEQVQMGSRYVRGVSIPPQIKDRAYFTRYLRRIDWAVYAISAIVATLLGLQILWKDPSSTWGSMMDLLTAYLWGLGFAEAGKITLSDTMTNVSKLFGAGEKGEDG